jgi:hypothetical protein
MELFVGIIECAELSLRFIAHAKLLLKDVTACRVLIDLIDGWLVPYSAT